METKVKQLDLPSEWVDLVKVAMEANITKDKFEIFLQKEKDKRENSKSDK